MKLLTLAAACAVVTLAAAPAFASEPVTAKLSQPLAQPTKFIAGGAVFNCDGDTCLAQAAISTTLSSDACKIIVGKVGPLASFTGRKPMDDTRLNACNATAVAHAAGPQLAKQ
jgi:curli biogenesis system outer membrane secretion channel CsgG